MKNPRRIAAAKAEAAAAQARFFETLDTLRQRLDPQALAAEQAEAIGAKAYTLMRSRPARRAVTAGGVLFTLATLAAFLWLARRGRRAKHATSPPLDS
jgi:hypothetical protein